MKSLRGFVTLACILAITFVLFLLFFLRRQYIGGPWTNLMLIVGTGGLLATVIVGLIEIKKKKELKKSVLVLEKYDSSVITEKQEKEHSEKSVFCTAKYSQNDGVVEDTENNEVE